MKILTKVPEQVVIKERVKVTAIVCDMCGKSARENGDRFDVSDTTIAMRIGSDYSHDGDNSITYIIDVCASCFLNKVRPLLPFREFRTEDLPPEERA